MTSVLDPIVAGIKEFILARFPLTKKRLKSDSDSLLEGGLIDSLGILEIVEFIENEYNIFLSTDDLVSENFETIRSIARFIQSKISGGEGASQRER